jgi:hypothetical protein
MSEKKQLIDAIGSQLRLQWSEILSEPMTTVLENLLQRLREAEAKQQADLMQTSLTTIGDASLDAVLCPSDVSENSRDLLADLRSAVEFKMKRSAH